MNVYVAGAWGYRHSPEFRALLDEVERRGWQVTYEWWNDDQDTAEKALLDLRGVREADALIVDLSRENYRYQGCWVELGYALALGKPVFVLGAAGDACIFLKHPNVRKGLPE